MGNLNVAVLGAPGLAEKIGKKGTVTDMTFYEAKYGEDSVTLLEPAKYPEKLSSLFYSAQMGDFVILVVDRIDARLGETVVMADALGRTAGWVVLRDYIQPEQVMPLIAGTSLEGYGFRDEDPASMREDLIAMARAEKREAGEGSRGSCPIDSHFNVKGVGTVVLGAVADGWFRVHDRMTVWPLGREVVLRSIQKHDVDAGDGVRGDHVGLALKGIDSDELDRGFVVSNDPDVRASERIEGVLDYVKYWPEPLKAGMVVHVGHWMQMLPCHVDSAGGKGGAVSMTVDSDTPLIHKPGDRAVVMYLEGGKLRVVGTIALGRTSREAPQGNGVAPLRMRPLDGMGSGHSSYTMTMFYAQPCQSLAHRE
ncbi:translation elongation factor 1 alpha-related protein [Methanomassiliicoccaceae archaeon COG_1]|nr:translation elongation factor 1 alpha-related protein [Methanomassiliicoccaceae archaeon COG_1]